MSEPIKMTACPDCKRELTPESIINEFAEMDGPPGYHSKSLDDLFQMALESPRFESLKSHDRSNLLASFYEMRGLVSKISCFSCPLNREAP